MSDTNIISEGGWKKMSNKYFYNDMFILENEQNNQNQQVEQSIVKKFSDALNKLKTSVENEYEKRSKDENEINKIAEKISNKYKDDVTKEKVVPFITNLLDTKVVVLNLLLKTLDELIENKVQENTLKEKQSFVDAIVSEVRKKITDEFRKRNGPGTLTYDGKINEFLEKEKYEKKVFVLGEYSLVEKYVEVYKEQIKNNQKIPNVSVILLSYLNDEGVTKSLVEEFYVQLAKSNFFKEILNKIKDELFKLFPGFKEASLKDKLRILKDGFVNIVKNPKDHKYAFGLMIIIVLILIAMIMKIPILRKFFGGIKKLITAPFRKVSAILTTLLAEGRFERYMLDSRYRLLHESVVRRIDMYAKMYSLV